MEKHEAEREHAEAELMLRGVPPVGLPPVHMMRIEHDAHGQALARMVTLAHGLAQPRGACNTLARAAGGLHTLREDLMQHIHLENNILFDGLNAPASGCGTGCGCGVSAAPALAH